jgi:outer membrane protein assembly factor BamB
MRPAPTTPSLRLASLSLALLTGLTGVSAHADDWPQWLGPQRDGVWREKGILKKFPKDGPKVLWRIPIGGGYAGPAVVGGRVYITDRVLARGEKDPENPFASADSRGKERVLCLDAKSGKQLWKHEYDCVYKMSYPCGPRATPVVHGGKVYTLGAMGDLRCLNSKDGTLIWKKNFIKEYDAPLPVWGFAAHPLLDGDQLICLVGGEGSVVVAFDKDRGTQKWKALSVDSSEIGYCPPMIYKVGKTRQLIIWHPESINSLNPKNGKVYWSQPFLARANLSISTPRLLGDKLFLTSFYNGCLMLQLDRDKPAARVLYRSKGRGETPKATDKLHAIMSTPFLKGKHIYGVCSYGQLRCLRLEDGKRVWSDLTATGAGKEPTRWANAFLVAQGERFFLFNEKGDLIIALLTPKGYKQIDRAHILDPTGSLPGGFTRPRKVVWSHPAFANKCLYARNDKQIVCVSLAESK